MASTITRLLGRGGIPLTRGVRLQVVEWDITSYPTNGEPLTPTLVGLTKITAISKPMNVEARLDTELTWDRANSKVKAYVANTGVEVANTTDIGPWLVVIFGR